MLNDHAALGEGAGLVGGQHAHRPQSLDGRQASDQGAPGRHAAGSEGEGEGDHGGQGLGYRGDGQADGGDRHRAHAEAAYEAQGEEQRAQGEGDGGQDAAEGGEAALERGLFVFPVEERCDAAEGAGGSCGRGRRDTPAAHHNGAGADRVTRSLGDGFRFAGEHGLVHEESRRLGEIGIRGDDVSLTEQQAVTRHHE